MNIANRRARFNYALEPERYEAGVSLTGGEAKAVRTGHADISQSVARIVNGEAYLINANVPVLGATKYDSKRTRKLLLHKDEIVALATKMKQRKLTLVPIKVYTKGRLVKLALALGRPKRKFEKKEALKQKDIKRELSREFKVK
ncbi:SsrA-binding protein SmpB [Candidatus Woesebacteria bacterium]|nr:SsrA-binding protein SmpB [Candidatus Woesebacteria bacterium]